LQTGKIVCSLSPKAKGGFYSFSPPSRIQQGGMWMAEIDASTFKEFK